MSGRQDFPKGIPMGEPRSTASQYQRSDLCSVKIYQRSRLFEKHVFLHLSGRQDLNLRPLGPQPSALPDVNDQTEL